MDEEIYCLTTGACLLLVLKDYGINLGVSARAACAIMNDLFELLAQHGHISQG